VSNGKAKVISFTHNVLQTCAAMIAPNAKGKESEERYPTKMERTKVLVRLLECAM
jgi:hypothetical protein